MDKETLFLKKLAKAYQTYDATIIEDDLADDVHYASFWVFQDLTSKEEYLDYLKAKLATMKRTNKTFYPRIVNGRRHDKALLMQNDAGFVVDFNDDGKVVMINMTAPAFF